MSIVTHRKLFYALSAITVAISIAALALWGLNLGIDFKGGSLMEIHYPSDAPKKTSIEAVLAPVDAHASVRPSGENGFIIRVRELSDAEHASLREALSFTGKSPVTEVRFDSIGPLLGKEAAGKSFLAIGLVIICIVLFITFAFRKVSLPVSSWKYGIITIIALAHDVLIPTGVFAFLGHFRGIEVDTLFVTALLVVLGFSVHDTIVVFDRVRENLRMAQGRVTHGDFETVVGASVSQTFTRSVNTSLTTLLALAVLLIFGPAATHLFALALIVGIVAGTYSSICIAAPLLVTAERRQKNA